MYSPVNSKRSINENHEVTKKRRVLERSNVLQERDDGQMLNIPTKNGLATPPHTPQKQRVQDISKQLRASSGRKKLVLTSTPPATPAKPKNTSIYSRAKALFQRANGGGLVSSVDYGLVGRADEASFLKNFLLKNIKERSCNSLYVSGPPGTGKTVQTSMVFDHITRLNEGTSHRQNTIQIEGNSVKILKVNCMSISNPENIFHEIHCGLDADEKLSTSYMKKKTADDLYGLLCHSSGVDTAVVLLDEMDSLITKDQQVLYQLFKFASPKNSQSLHTKLILIGISNALDLTDKFLPRLKRNGLNPQSLVFLPYTADQIKSIIIHKLDSLYFSDKENQIANASLIHPAGISLCCKKAASITGDLRKAFDICYKSIELVENGLLKSKSPQEISLLKLHEAPKVLISHVAKVCTTTFGTDASKKLENLNLLQKAVLCCLFNYQANFLISKSQLTVNSLYDFYIKHTNEHAEKLLSKVKKGEFLDIISALEASSVIVLSLSSKKGNVFSVDFGSRLVKANIPYDDLEKSIDSIGVLTRLLHGKSS